MIWDIFLFMLMAFYVVAYIFVVVLVIVDLFRDDTLAGGWKALWILFLVFVPMLTALVYVIARGRGMAARSARRSHPGAAEVDDYRPSASADPSGDIAKAKELLDAGVISQGEFDALKSKALGNQYFG
ncbi:SHOCT domain-containing protein [Microbacterium aquimaris]|uniref:SHOCT domain-containing protein n=1 Tax=Microbacterium aquimaris TaxID=459816 RepID=UPI002AD3D764|nr:SHOCT domain-containing protein [Microbacterium aquimaris]MDZ8276071.1 SHOCT domain-containing protein [Microbacterium aquimaris]